MSGIANSILHLHGWVALTLVFAMPMLESAAFVGFVFPGETAAILAGVLAYEHRIGLLSAMIAVVLGAIVGDTIGYEVGRHWGTRLINGPLARWIKVDHLRRTERVLARRGGWAVFFGRFTVALRVLVPGIAGVGLMPYRRFAFFNMTGGLVWGVSFVLIGYVAGAGWRAVASTASTIGLVVLAVVIVAALLVLLRRRRRRARSSGVPVRRRVV